ncbi:MAG TPA: hypothetical protein VMT26_02980 [Candidatus Bathyarchaeia archaeon]|jgi:hypothetical protein|nr:hypothetical protein [Candidatus Bathyarchaeia archaeon]
MSWKDVICLLIALLGVVLFLYGANYYDALIGWAGIFLIVISFLAWLVLKLYALIRKKDGKLEAVEL